MSSEFQQLIEITKNERRVGSVSETLEKIAEAGCKKCHMTPFESLLLSGFLGGCLISFGGYVSLLTGRNIRVELASDSGDHGIEELNIKGLNNLIAAATFPVGVIIVILFQIDLFMGNTLILTVSFLMGKSKWYGVLKVLLICYLSNLFGVFFVSFFLVYLVKQPHDPEHLKLWQRYTVENAILKCELPYYSLFFGGLSGTFLVALAVILSSFSTHTSGKILGAWFPVFSFAAIGLDNCIVDAFFIILGLFYGAGTKYWGLLCYNLFFVTLGNIIGGSLFVGVTFWYIFRSKGGFGKSVWIICRHIWKLWFKSCSDIESRQKENEIERVLELEEDQFEVEENSPLSPSDVVVDRPGPVENADESVLLHREEKEDVVIEIFDETQKRENEKLKVEKED